MSQTATFVLREERDRDFAVRFIQRTPLDGKREVIIRAVRRSNKQNKRYWSMINALVQSESTVIAGRAWDAVGWHEIMLSLYHTEVRGEAPTIIAGAAGEFLSMHRTSKDLDTQQFGDLMTSTLAFIDKNGIVWEEREQHGDQRPEPPPRQEER